jgi:hypothetical protein
MTGDVAMNVINSDPFRFSKSRSEDVRTSGDWRTHKKVSEMVNNELIIVEIPSEKCSRIHKRGIADEIVDEIDALATARSPVIANRSNESYSGLVIADF